VSDDQYFCDRADRLQFNPGPACVWQLPSYGATSDTDGADIGFQLVTSPV